MPQYVKYLRIKSKKNAGQTRQVAGLNGSSMSCVVPNVKINQFSSCCEDDLKTSILCFSHFYGVMLYLLFFTGHFSILLF